MVAAVKAGSEAALVVVGWVVADGVVAAAKAGSEAALVAVAASEAVLVEVG